MGICIGGYGISSTLWSQLQLAIANPNNVDAITPEGAESDDAYFEDPDVLDRVPTLIYVMAGLYAVFLTIGMEKLSPKDISWITCHPIISFPPRLGTAKRRSGVKEEAKEILGDGLEEGFRWNAQKRPQPPSVLSDDGCQIWVHHLHLHCASILQGLWTCFKL